MHITNDFVLFGSLLLLISIVASAVSSRLGAPMLLGFLVLGMLAGEDGPGGIRFDDVYISQLVGCVALALILFDGGMRTRREVFRVGLWPAVSLATIGVGVTAVIVGLIAAYLLQLHWIQGLLIGAIVGSTDAAVVFSVIHAQGTALKQRVASTLEIESGSNDPMAVFLVIALIEVLISDDRSLHWGILLDLIRQFVLGCAAGLIGGRMLVWLINRLTLVSALYPLLAAAGGLSIYAATTAIDGSGFLAIYLAGLVLGNRPLQAAQNILRVHDGLAWLSQISMFLILGLLITPHQLLDITLEGFAIALSLIFLARPIAVVVSLLPFRFPWHEQLFISWVGLRGAVPIILALFPLIAGLEHSRLYFNIAFFVVLVSLVLQGWTVGAAARWLKLEIPPTPEPLQRFNLDIPGHFDREIACYVVAPESRVANRPIAEIHRPDDMHITTIVRDGVVMTSDERLKVLPGDHVYIFTSPTHVPYLNKLFEPLPAAGRLESHQFFGDFVLEGTALLSDVADMYGLPLDRVEAGRTLADYLFDRFHGRAVIGDRAKLGSAELVVKDIEDRRVTKVGLRLR